MAFVLQGLRRAAAAGGSVWSAQGSRLMSSSSSLNRLPQITSPSTTSVSPSSLQVLLQRVFPLGRPTTKVITTLPAPVPAKPTLVVGSAEKEGFECLNRNARRGKKANHGKRPVSSARRRQKHRTFGRKNG